MSAKEWDLRIGGDHDRSVDADGVFSEGSNVFVGDKEAAFDEAKRRAVLYFSGTENHEDAPRFYCVDRSKTITIAFDRRALTAETPNVEIT